MLNFHNKLTALRDKQKSDEGFTLIELLVVVLIIGVLAAIAIPIFLTQQQQAAQAGLKADLANAKIGYVSAVVSGATTPTLQQIKDNGYTGTSTLTLGTANTKTTFCISTTDGTKTFRITDSTGAVEGIACP